MEKPSGVDVDFGNVLVKIWIMGTIFAVVLLLCLSAFAFRGARWMQPLSYVFGVLMLFNGLLHLAGSIYLGRLMPGVYSSPLLLAGSIYLLAKTRPCREQIRP